MSSRIVCLVWLLSLVSIPSAHAKGRSDALDKAAKKACAAGDFRKGVDILADLYVQTDDVNYVYNQGRCYEQNHQWREAIDRFREFQRKSRKLPAEVQADVEKHIADCKLFIEEETARAAPPPVAPLPAPPPVAPVPIVVVPPPAPQPPPPTRPPGATLRTTGIILGSAGIATLAAALALNLKANSLADEANRTQDPATESSQKSYKTGAIVCYGIGGVALLTGATLYLVGRAKATTKDPSMSILPTWSPEHAGLILRGGF
jgi:hypothetical protein